MKYIASWSGGKDSTASIILAHIHKEPLDTIIFSEVMFDKNTSGELPEHIAFVKNCIPLFQSWGYDVEILHSEYSYMDMFHHINTKGKRKGMKQGFVMSGKCNVQKYCKLRQIKEYFKTIDGEFTQYIGIATDEPKRLERIVDAGNKVSLLKKYEYTEQMAHDLCKQYGLLSPIYQFTKRGGCWFCPNATKPQLRYLWDNHRELIEKLVELEKEENLSGDIWNTLTKTRITDIAENFMWEDRQMTIFDLL